MTVESRVERPRVEGDREDEILDATVELLLDAGYDRLTMDAVAKKARASKATLYRRWSSKQSLVVDAVSRSKRAVVLDPPDTGSLRGDLIALFCGSHGIGQGDATRLLGVVITSLQTDPEFATEFRSRFLAPKVGIMLEIYRRAAERGELAPGVDPTLLGPALAGIILHRSIVLDDPVTPEMVARVVDQIILPAATGRHPSQSQEPR
jgi:AcrR family transcriptional regulator